MSDVEKKIDKGILTLTLNRPEKLNALSAEVLEALDAAFTEAKQNDAVKAIIITGQGKAFCAGADISRLAACDAERGYQFAQLGHNVFRHLETLGKPSLAVVNGYTFGGGCELAMAATLRIAAGICFICSSILVLSAKSISISELNFIVVQLIPL